MSSQEFQRTMPDWGRTNPDQLAEISFDVAEGMARIGSPASYTRTGKVMYLTGFELDKNDWQVRALPVDAACDVTTDVALRGSRCLMLTPGSADPSLVAAYKVFPLLRYTKFGVECLFHMASGATNFEFNVQVETPLVASRFWVRCNANGDIEIWTLAGVETVISSGSLVSDDWNSWLLKLVFDLEENKYTRLRLNDQEVDISDKDPTAMTLKNPGRFIVELQADDTTRNQNPIYVDDLIVTVDEA